MGVMLRITRSMVKYDIPVNCTRCPPQLLSDQSSLPNSGYPSHSICNSFYHRESPSIDVHPPQESSQAQKTPPTLDSSFPPAVQPESPPIPAITYSPVSPSASMALQPPSWAAILPCHTSNAAGFMGGVPPFTKKNGKFSLPGHAMPSCFKS